MRAAIILGMFALLTLGCAEASTGPIANRRLAAPVPAPVGARSVQVHDLVVSYGHSQFSLFGGPFDGDPYPVLLEALEGEGVASNGALMAVLSPQQWNFHMPLRIEQWDEEPVADLPEWQVVFQAPLTISNGSMIYVPTEGLEARIPLPTGQYQVRVSGRGFTTFGMPDLEPQDSWRIQLWPSGEKPHRALRLKQWSGPAR